LNFTSCVMSQRQNVRHSIEQYPADPGVPGCDVTTAGNRPLTKHLA